VLAVVSAAQAVITLAFHCAELLVNLSRDEKLWRRATRKEGLDIKYNSIIAAATSWATISLFILKPVVHWVFGFSMTAASGSTGGIDMRAPQILYLTLVAAIAAVVASIIGWRRPKGPQPATYGHLQTLADLIDEWHPVMFWGHKGTTEGVSHAGTSSGRLPAVDMAELYR